MQKNGGSGKEEEKGKKKRDDCPSDKTEAPAPRPKSWGRGLFANWLSRLPLRRIHE